MPVVTLGVHIVDVLTRPVESIPPGQDTVLVEQIRPDGGPADRIRPPMNPGIRGAVVGGGRRPWR